MPSSKTKVDDGFLKLGSEVHLRKPLVASDDGESPNIILVFGWMGAKLRHLHKYTKVYEELYPGATQVLVTSPPSFFYCTEGSKRRAVAPVVEILEALGAIPGMPSAILEKKKAPTSPRILIHSFSNGGAYCMMTLGKLLATHSAPGGGGLGSAIDAFTGHMRNPVGKFGAKVFISTLYLFGYMVGPMLGRKTSLQRIRESLYAAHLLPWMDKRTPRLYLYSKKDEMVPWVDTETHARASKDMGRNVKTVVFEDSAHVAHAKTYPVEYWDAVKSIWNEANQAEHSPFE
ncbi:hypothetical protein BDZ89DRAFT_1143031 [Hymenopellis radicata]|nr:hypothetical protein BDZ89DRAFT_1143031 [Hymenopellis radicata]